MRNANEIICIFLKYLGPYLAEGFLTACTKFNTMFVILVS